MCRFRGLGLTCWAKSLVEAALLDVLPAISSVAKLVCMHFLLTN